MTRKSVHNILAVFTVLVFTAGIAACGHDHDEENEHEHNQHEHNQHEHNQHEHNEHEGEHGIHEIELIDRSDDTVFADAHGDHWHGQIVLEEGGDHLSVGFQFLDGEEEVIDLDVGGDVSYEVSGYDDSVITTDSHSDHVHVHPEEAGDTELVFEFFEGEESIYLAGGGQGIDVVVVAPE